MALKTKQQVVDEIIYEIYAGIPSNTRSISDNFVVRILNNHIAEAAVKSAFASYNLDGIVAADDIFTLTYSNIALSVDPVTGNKYFTHPAQPVGLPNKRAMTIFPPKQRGGAMSSIFKGILRSDVTKVRSMPPIKKVFHYTENGCEQFIDDFQIMNSYDTINLSIISSGANDLAAFLNLPDDMITSVKTLCVAECKQMMQLMDTSQLPPQDSPQPRK